MKTSRLALLLALAAVAQAQSTLLSDDFNTLNTAVWNVQAPMTDSRMTATGGTATFFQRGAIVTKADLPVALEIRGRFAFVGGTYDQLSIALRSDGTMIAPYYPFQTAVGVQFNMRGGDDGNQTGQRNVYLLTGTGRPAVIANFTFQIGTYYDFRIVDDGRVISVYLNNQTAPIVEGVASEREGYKIGFQNRGSVPWFPLNDNQARLDSLTILAPAAAPVITAQSAVQSMIEGESVVLSVTAVSPTPMTYQWFRNGTAVAGATNATLELASVRTTDSGTYFGRATNASGAVTGNSTTLTVRAATVPPGRFINLSTLASGTIVSGFVVGGSSSRNVLVRAVGPGLRAFGVTDAAPQAGLTLFAGQTIIATNAGWSVATNAAQIAAVPGPFPLVAGSADGAILTTLSPGNYSARAVGSGTVLLEVYEVP